MLTKNKYMCSCDGAYTKAGRKLIAISDRTELYEVDSANGKTCDFCSYAVFIMRPESTLQSTKTFDKNGVNHRYDTSPAKKKSWKTTVSEWHKTDSPVGRNKKQTPVRGV